MTYEYNIGPVTNLLYVKYVAFVYSSFYVLVCMIPRAHTLARIHKKIIKALS